MKPKYYPVVLNKEDKAVLKGVINGNGASGQTRTRARILLAMDESNGSSPEQAAVADILKTSTATIYNTTRAFFESGIERALTRKKRTTPPVPAKVDGDVEAHVIAMACAKSPEGYARWTVRLLKDRVRACEELPDLSHTTIASILKKHHLSLT